MEVIVMRHGERGCMESFDRRMFRYFVFALHKVPANGRNRIQNKEYSVEGRSRPA